MQCFGEMLRKGVSMLYNVSCITFEVVLYVFLTPVYSKLKLMVKERSGYINHSNLN